VPPEDGWEFLFRDELRGEEGWGHQQNGSVGRSQGAVDFLTPVGAWPNSLIVPKVEPVAVGERRERDPNTF